MGGEHQPGFTLKGLRASFILLDGIDEDQAPARALYEEIPPGRDLKISPIWPEGTGQTEPGHRSSSGCRWSPPAYQFGSCRSGIFW